MQFVGMVSKHKKRLYTLVVKKFCEQNKSKIALIIERNWNKTILFVLTRRKKIGCQINWEKKLKRFSYKVKKYLPKQYISHLSNSWTSCNIHLIYRVDWYYKSSLKKIGQLVKKRKIQCDNNEQSTGFSSKRNNNQTDDLSLSLSPTLVNFLGIVDFVWEIYIISQLILVINSPGNS